VPWLCELCNLHELNYSKNKPRTDCRVVGNIDYVWGVIIAIKICHDMNQYRDIRYDTIYRAIATTYNAWLIANCWWGCILMMSLKLPGLESPWNGLQSWKSQKLLEVKLTSLRILVCILRRKMHRISLVVSFTKDGMEWHCIVTF